MTTLRGHRSTSDVKWIPQAYAKQTYRSQADGCMSNLEHHPPLRILNFRRLHNWRRAVPPRTPHVNVASALALFDVFFAACALSVKTDVASALALLDLFFAACALAVKTNVEIWGRRGCEDASEVKYSLSLWRPTNNVVPCEFLDN